MTAQANVGIDETTSVAPQVAEVQKPANCAGAKKIWVDLDNSPHVPFFVPVIRELETRGFAVILTARDAFQVSELVKLHGLKCRCVGRHYGKHTVWKALGLGIRSFQLLRIARHERPDLALAHCSRAQAIASKLLRIPVLWISDYEFAKGLPFLKVDWLMTPEVIQTGAVDFRPDRILRYPGIKEDVYVPTFQPDPGIKAELGLAGDDLIVTVRPPAEEAHYHCARSDELFRAAMDHLSNQPSVKLILLPRNQAQAARLRKAWSQLFNSGRAIIPARAVDGLNLIWHSDLVISGGGTMNREAAALGVPVYSIFGGAIGAVDRFLAETGRLVLLSTAGEVQTKIKLTRRKIAGDLEIQERPALKAVVENIVAAYHASIYGVSNDRVREANDSLSNRSHYRSPLA